MPDAEVIYQPGFLDADLAYSYLNKLIEICDWREENVILFGKTFKSPRLISYYGEQGSDLHYSGISLAPKPWNEPLQAIRQAVENYTGLRFNGVLVNYYRNNLDSMSLHSDDERELGPKPVIPSVSLGAERIFKFRHKFRKDLKPLSLNLGNGSLLLMQGQTQSFWKHELPKSKIPCGPRINLTFRKVSS